MPKPTRVSIFLTPGLLPGFVEELESLGAYHRSKRLLSLAIRGYMAERGMPSVVPTGVEGTTQAAKPAHRPPTKSNSARAKSSGPDASKTSREQADADALGSADLSVTFASLSQ